MGILDRIGRLTVLAATAAALLVVPAAADAAEVPITITSFDVSTPAPPPAGGHTDLTLSMDFCPTVGPDPLVCSSAQQNNLLQKVDVSLPPGLIGNPFAAPRCPVPDFEAGTCPASSVIGSVDVWISTAPEGDANQGSTQFGRRRLFNLPSEGSEVGRFGSNIAGIKTISKATVRTGGDYGVDVRSVSSAPAKISRLNLTLDGSSVPFMSNPTSCNPGTVTATVTGDDGPNLPVSASDGYQAVGCGSLGFDPVTQASAGGAGSNGRGGSPGMRILVTRPNGGAQIKSAQFFMPRQIRPTIAGIAAHTCKRSQAPACPGVAPIGTATVTMPVLSAPLSGPVYLVEVPGQLALDMMAKLTGPLTADFNGRASFGGLDSSIADAGQRAVISVNGLPDLPITSFELSIAGGSGGILAATENLCNGVRVGTTYAAHNGADRSFGESSVSIDGCRTAVALVRQTIKVPKSGAAAVKVTCLKGGADCNGRVTLKAGKKAVGSAAYQELEAGSTKSIKVKLSAKTRRKLAKKRRMKIQGIATASGGSQGSAGVTLKAAKKKKKKARKHR